MCCWKVQVSCFYIDDTRYKTKKPVPSNNTYVAVDGFLDHICVDTGHVIMVMWDAKRGGEEWLNEAKVVKADTHLDIIC